MKHGRPFAPVLGALLALAQSAGAQVNELPKEYANVGIDERPGAKLPLDVRLTNQDGKAVKLGDYLDGKRPLILVLAYYQCPMLCTMVLNGLKDGLEDLAWGAGERYRVLTVSIDPSDTAELARQKRDNYHASYGRKIDGDGWDFTIATEGEVRRLADAVGFHYQYDAAQKQYAHAAGAFVITPAGTLSRTLYGIQFGERDLRLSLIEASEGKLGSAWEKILLLCYHYDPAAKSYTIAATRVMRIGGLITLATLLALLGWLFKEGQLG